MVNMTALGEMVGFVFGFITTVVVLVLIGKWIRGKIKNGKNKRCKIN